MVKSNNIDIDIFMSLKACEKSGVTPLYLGNPGIGKSTAVAMFCKIRGYELLILRGSSSSPEELLGYDVANEKVTESGYAKKLFPSWFKTIMDNEEKGKRTLLFLDELSTCNEFTQAAMLELIFSRRVSEDVFLPDDCFVVSAGNYFANLSSSFNIIPPTLNRFVIINLTPTTDDLDIFLSKYDGSLSGKKKDVIKELSKKMEELDKQEKDYDESTTDKIGEYIERAIKDQVRLLINQGQVDMSVADLSSIYSDDYHNGDPTVYGFITLRTLNYLRDISIAYYTCYGISGIKSSNYKKVIDGLCGIGLSWGSDKKQEPKKNVVSKYFFDAISSAANEIKKMSISRLPEYEKYLFETTDKPSYDVPVMQALINKLNEMKADKEVNFDELQMPIDVKIVNNIRMAATATLNAVTKINIKDISTGVDKALDTVTKEKIIGMITSWNTLASLLTCVGDVVMNPKAGYKDTEKSRYSDFIKNVRGSAFKLRSLKKLLMVSQPEFYAMIPEIASITLGEENEQKG